MGLVEYEANDRDVIASKPSRFLPVISVAIQAYDCRRVSSPVARFDTADAGDD
jgi:hypothetical protein